MSSGGAGSGSKSRRVLTQLIALTPDNINFYYGEFVDDHLIRGSPRAIYRPNVSVVPISPEWKTFLKGRKLEIECSGSKWISVGISADGPTRMLKHDSGYIIPIIGTGNKTICEFFQHISDTPKRVMPSQRVAPPSVVVGRVVERVDRDDDSDAEATIGDDDTTGVDEWKKERDALSAAVEGMMKKKKRSSSSIKFK